MNKFLDYKYNHIKCDVELPKPIIQWFEGVQVVRDDLLDGGTKRRAFNIAGSKIISAWNSFDRNYSGRT